MILSNQVKCVTSILKFIFCMKVLVLYFHGEFATLILSDYIFTLLKRENNLPPNYH